MLYNTPKRRALTTFANDFSRPQTIGKNLLTNLIKWPHAVSFVGMITVLAKTSRGSGKRTDHRIGKFVGYYVRRSSKTKSQDSGLNIIRDRPLLIDSKSQF